MATQHPPAPTTPTVSPALVQAARDYSTAARAPRTYAAYTSDWADFTTWCSEHGFEPLPAEPAAVALYLADRADTLKPSTLTRRAAAISVHHGERGLPSPTADPRVRQVLSGIKRTKGTAPDRVAPATVGDVRRMVALLPDSPIGHRDAALLLLGLAGALRRSELVGLNVGDIKRRDRGLEITIRRSKTDQEGKGRTVAIPYGQDPHTCPVRALDRWLQTSGITKAAIFRPVDRHGNVSTRRLSGAAVSLIIKRAAREAGLDDTSVSGHSLRAGFVTSAALAGASERQIADQTGHKSVAVLRDYVRTATVFEDNAVNLLGL